MRIIAGQAKGRKLITPNGDDVRPTTDRVKEAVFSMIAPYIHGSLVLDLFSGTGNLGLEAISRGAEKAFFVDKSRDSIKIISRNILKLDMKSKSEIKNTDALKAIDDFRSSNIKFDIIFMDPPYGKGIIKSCIEEIDRSGLLNKDGIIVIEHNELEKIDANIGNLNILKDKKYGNTIITIYTNVKET